MKFSKIYVIGFSALLIAATGCSAPSGQSAVSSGVSSEAVSTASVSSQAVSSNSGANDTSSEKPILKSASSAKLTVSKTISPTSQNDWVAYSNSKDNYKLHIKRKDGTGDKVIVNDVTIEPCVARDWVYYFADLDNIVKVKLDGSQKTKVCNTDGVTVYNANIKQYHEINGSTYFTGEYKDGYILYKFVQLHQEGEKANPPSYYKLDLKQNKLIPVKN